MVLALPALETNLWQQSFRNWVNGLSKGAGAWGRDEIRNITGAVGMGPDTVVTDALGAFNTPYPPAAHSNQYIEPAPYYNSFGFNVSLVVPTGPQNVPQHVYVPVILYLGRPAQV
jgi:hypothetical protein